MRYILAIDQGTSGTKAIVFDEEGAALAKGSAPVHAEYYPDGRVEQDAESIYRSVVSAARSAVEVFESETGISRSEIACAGIANQRETFVLWNRDGRPVHPAVVWQCKRSVDVCAELEAAGYGDEVRERTGLIIDPYFSGTKIAAVLRSNVEVRAAYENRDLFFGTVDSWLLYRLSNGRKYKTDYTNASRTLLFNISDLAWDRELARILGLEGLELPEPSVSAGELGESDFDGVLRDAIPITAIVGDSHSALFGERCFHPGDAKATLGTGCSIMINAGPRRPEVGASSMTTLGFALSGRIDYALEGIIVSAGSIITWLREGLGLEIDTGVLDTAGEVESTGVVIVPGHAGLGAPFWKMDATGSIHGLTFGTRPGHLARAALESIVYQIKAVLDSVVRESSVSIESIRVDGGIAVNRFVASHLADASGVPVHTSSIPDITALGAALLASIGCGIHPGIDAIEALDLGNSVIPPSGDRSTALAGYEHWKRVVDGAVR